VSLLGFAVTESARRAASAPTALNLLLNVSSVTPEKNPSHTTEQLPSRS